AVRALDAIGEMLRARGPDEAALRALVSDDFVYDDRGRRSLLRGGVEEWLRSVRYLLRERGARIDTRLLATAGDRLALHHFLIHETVGPERFELEGFRIVELDADGKQRALILFDHDQRAAASAELFERWVASGADGLPAAAIEVIRAMNDHDLDLMR